MPVKRVWPWLNRWGLYAGAGAIGIFILGANVYYGLTAGDGLIMANKRLIAGDFMAFWSAGRMTLEGAIEQVHAARPIYEEQLRHAPGLDVVYLWHHPPTFLLIATGLAFLPYLAAAGLFFALTALLYGLATRAITPAPAALFFAAMAPASAMHFGNVQTGLLTAALAGFALLSIDRRPLVSGALVGLFAIKPHLAVLYPLAFAAGGRWRAFIAATAVTLGFVGLTLWAFGWEAWRAFFDNMAHAQSMVTEQKIAPGTYATVFANLRGLGAPVWAAGAAHGASALLAAAVVAWMWRRGGGPYAGAALAAASTLMSPYLFFYDLTLLLVAGALIARQAGGWSALTPWEQAALAYGWLAPGLLFSVGHYEPLPFAALAAWGLVIVAVRRTLRPAESAQADPAPAPPPSGSLHKPPPYRH
jgi:hypothetical protein